MAVLHDNTNRIHELIADISALPKDRYEEGYTKGYNDCRSSFDLLSNIECEKITTYYGKRLDSFGDQQLIFLATLKKGKTVPSGSFGHIKKAIGNNVTAGWTVNGGTFQPRYCYIANTPSTYEWSMIGCYPATQETWDAFMDAFDVRVELIDTEI